MTLQVKFQFYNYFTEITVTSPTVIIYSKYYYQILRG
uniref:Uncharacterized protein n=1 Tax=Lepeophtheirus salmonis TaxID=72036 RepID=A0A0K2TG59_LEPSM